MTGWEALPFVSADGQNWPVSFAAEVLDVTEEDLRDLIRILKIEPSGVIRMASFRRQGRQPKAYPAARLIRACEVAASLREEFSGSPADSGPPLV